MKRIAAGLLLLVINGVVIAQTRSVVDQAVEGGKLLVELIKVFSSDNNATADTGCKGRYADLCIANARDSSLTVILTHRASKEIRDLVIAPRDQECSLQLSIGVWTYDLRFRRSDRTIRKGDLLIEGCQNLEMTIKDQ